MAIKFYRNFEKNNFANVLKKYKYQFTVGNIIAGKIVGFEKGLCKVDIGSNHTACLPLYEICLYKSFLSKEIFEKNQISEFVLLQYEPNKNISIISLKRLKSIIIWQRLKNLNQENLICFGQLQKSIKQGKFVMIQGLKSFVENSNLPKYYRHNYQQFKFRLPFKIIELSQAKNKIFVSCKLAHFKNQTNFIKTNQSICGCITQIKSYGLFVNIYGLKGLLHISEISSDRISDLTKVFKKGQLINVKILYINFNQGRIALSLKFS